MYIFFISPHRGVGPDRFKAPQTGVVVDFARVVIAAQIPRTVVVVIAVQIDSTLHTFVIRAIGGGTGTMVVIGAFVTGPTIADVTAGALVTVVETVSIRIAG